MKIAFESTCLTSPHLTGIGQYALQLFQRLKPMVAARAGTIEPFLKITRFRKRKLVEAHLHTSSRMFHPQFQWGLSGYDVFHGPDFRVPYVRGIAKVVTIHDLCEFESDFHPKAFTEKGIQHMHSIISQANPHYFMADSNFTRQRLQHYFPTSIGRTAVVPLGADHLIQRAQHFINYKPNLSDENSRILNTKFILFVGAIEKRKNVHGIVESFIASSLPAQNYQLVLIGKLGHGAQDILPLIRSSPHIHYLGFVSENELIQYYQHAQFFVFPSLYEGFGFPILEAMSFGLPVITSQTTACGETAGTAALTVDPTSTREIIAALESFAHQPEQREKFRQLGFARAQEFKWQRCAEQTFIAYEETRAQLRAELKNKKF